MPRVLHPNDKIRFMPKEFVYYKNLKLNKVYKVEAGSEHARNLSWMSKDHMVECDEEGNTSEDEPEMVIEIELENPPEDEDE